MHIKDTHIILTEEFIQIDSKKTPLKDYLIWDIIHEFAEATGLSIDAHYTEFDTVYASPEDPKKRFYNRLILLCADVLRKGLARVEFDERTYDRMTTLVSKYVNHQDVFLNIYARDTWFFGNTKMYILGYRGSGGALMPDIRIRRPEIKLRLERV